VAAGFAAVIVVGVLLLGLLRPTSNQQVAGITDAPTGPGVSTIVGEDPSTNASVSNQPAATEEPPAGTAADPGATGGAGGGPGPTPGPTSPGVGTPAPTPPPLPTPSPTQAPTPLPTPTPPEPTATPGALCTVITLINHWTVNAQRQWTTAGFTGTVIFNPAPPPDYHIKWQSLAMGATVPCSSNITVRDTLP
jgi:hypothetical protein